jgi:SAM-dependent methyltransferase
VAADPCLVCEGRLGEPIEPPRELGGVTSDMKPWPRFGEIVVCARCGHVQKDLNEGWREQTERIYADYELNLLSGGTEKVIFSQNGALTRSERVLGAVQEVASLPTQGRMLDIGCGNGATLRAFGRRLPWWRLSGFEVNARTRDEVLSLPGVEGFVAGELEAVEGEFDCITLIHVLEHLPDPMAVLRWVRPHLAPGGLLVVQIPDIAANPLDLAVFDHSSHFDPPRLSAFMTALGFDTIEIGGHVAKEITGVFRDSSRETTAVDRSEDAAEVEARVRADIGWLASTLEAALDLAQEAPLGVFGTAVAGTWLAGRLGERVSFFVDEDPQRIGKRHIGLPVLAPAEVPPGSSVFIASTPRLAEEIRNRLTSAAAAWKPVSPPPLDATETPQTRQSGRDEARH